MNNSYAHGGVEIQGNKCFLTVGSYKMLFTGYQPKTAGEEFCDDIPIAGRTIIVLDFIDPILRTMVIDYRVLKDVNEIGVKATLEDVGNIHDLNEATVFYIPPEQYQRGTFMLNRNFEAGQYIGVLSVRHPESGDVETSVFPFSVGVQPRKNWIGISILLFFSVLVLTKYILGRG